MIEIIPATLPKRLEDLERDLTHLRGVAPLVQVDLVGTNILHNEEAMPLWQEFDFEFDLMLPDPLAELDSVMALGASRIVIHAATKTAREALEKLQPMRDGDLSIAVGLALAAHDTPEVLSHFSGLYDYVQVMGIDHIGAQGEPPDPHHKELELIQALRAMYSSLVIQVDGAAAAHPEELVRAGADRLVVGSAIVRAEDPKAALKTLYTKVNG